MSVIKASTVDGEVKKTILEDADVYFKKKNGQQLIS